MSLVTTFPSAFVRANLVGKGLASKRILRYSSTRAEPSTAGTSNDSSSVEMPSDVSDEGDIVREKDDDPEEYTFTSQNTPTLTNDDKAYLDKFRPKVHPRLSKVYRGYTSLDEDGWTIPYSKMGWYSMKQIYGHYDDNNERSHYYIHPRSPLMKLLRDPFTPKAYAFDYWKEKRDVDICKEFQQIQPDKLYNLGPELMAAHFVCSFGGKVKFHGFKNWFDKTNWKSLPQTFAKEFICEAVDLSNTPLFYEGMSFLMRLSDLRSLNLANCTALDEWAINRLYPLRSTLVHLDLSGCHGISDRGVATLWKMKALKRLVLSGLDESVNNLPLMAMELEEQLPGCFIDGVDFESKPNPKVSGIPADYDPESQALMEKYNNDVSKIEYEKWWGLEGQSFDHENFKYKWRGRPFRNDWDDIVEDAKEESGWLFRLFSVNPLAPPKENPKRRV